MRSGRAPALRHHLRKQESTVRGRGCTMSASQPGVWLVAGLVILLLGASAPADVFVETFDGGIALERWTVIDDPTYTVQAPDAEDEKETKTYYEAVAEAYKLALTAYMKSLYRLQQDAGYTKHHEEKVQEFVQALYDNDFAVNMGKKIFKDKFEKYWMSGFWAIQIGTKKN